MNEKIQKPPPYSYDLAVSIYPGWEHMEKTFPFRCAGPVTQTYYRPPGWVACEKQVVWWHPFVPQATSFCDDCCPIYYKRMFSAYWRESKLRLIAQDWFSTKRGRILKKAFNLSEANQKNIVEIVGGIGLITWDFRYLSTLAAQRARMAFIKRLAKEFSKS